MREPHCPVCGYTAKDAAIHLDHHLCKGKIPASKAKIPQAKSEPEERFLLAWRALGGPAPEREYKFHPTRKWRFDFAWPMARVAVEIDGGAHEGAARGRHMRQAGFAADCAKLNAAAEDSWVIFRYTPGMIQPAAIEELKKVVWRRLPTTYGPKAEKR